MSMITVSGFLKNPINDKASQAEIKITTIRGFNQLLPTSTVTLRTGTDGSYSFPLLYGVHKIEYKFKDKFTSIGNVTINDTLSGTYTISEIIKLTVPPVNPEIIEMKRILSEVNSATVESNKSTLSAKEYAEKAELSANRAEAALNQLLAHLAIKQ